MTGFILHPFYSRRRARSRIGRAAQSAIDARLSLLQVCAFVLLAGCAPAPGPTPAARVEAEPVAAIWPAAAAPAAEEAIPALIVAERLAAGDGDLGLLRQLWAVDARIVDGRGTPEDSDDYVWAGRDAILDRYELAVFPAPPPPLDNAQLAALAITVEGGTAQAELGVDRWRFVYRDGRWLLAELRYN